MTQPRLSTLRCDLCVGALVVHERQLLLAKRIIDPWADCWDIPGGFCEPDEHPIVAARRETKEETGLTVTITGYLGIWFGAQAPSSAEPERPRSANLYYHAVSDSSEFREDGTEISQARWFDSNLLPTAVAFPGHQRSVLRAWQEAFSAGRLTNPLFDDPQRRVDPAGRAS